jgi:hypothetical protein
VAQRDSEPTGDAAERPEPNDSVRDGSARNERHEMLFSADGTLLGLADGAMFGPNPGGVPWHADMWPGTPSAKRNAGTIPGSFDQEQEQDSGKGPRK